MYPHGAAQALHQLVANRQPQTIAAVQTGGLNTGLLKALKNFLDAVSSDANPRVLHFKQQRCAFASHPQAHRPLVGELDGVAQQVNQHLRQAVPVGDDGDGDIVRHAQAVIDVHAVDFLLKQFEGAGDGGA